MNRSEQIHELAAALASAQKAFEAAERGHTAKVETRSGGSYSFNYADLAAYLDVCRDALGSNGLAVIQDPNYHEGRVTVTTTLTHSSGQWIESSPLVMPVFGQGEKNIITPQSIGSAITYARRYSLSALIGMASEADDDGNAASGNTADVSKRTPNPNCPQCGSNANVIKGREDFGGGWLCWNKPDKGKHGCGHKWHEESNHEANGKADPRKSVDTKDTHIAAIKAAESISALAAYCKAADLKSLSPPDKDAVIDAAKSRKLFLSLEEIDHLQTKLQYRADQMTLLQSQCNFDPADPTQEQADALIAALKNELPAKRMKAGAA